MDTDVSSHLSAWEAKALNIYEQGVFLHILADTLGSAGVIVSAILMWAFGWMIADPICSIFIAILIGMSVWHLLADSVAILMQRTPKQLDHQLADCYQRVMQLEGVQGVHEQVLKKFLLPSPPVELLEITPFFQHFWTLCSNYYCGGLKLEVLPDCDPKYIIRYDYQMGVISTRSIYPEFHFITILFSHTQNIFRGVNVTQLYIQVSF